MDDSQGLNAIDRALARALDVEVSPDFEARVRQRIASEPMRAPFWRGWRLAVPAAAAVIAAVGLAMVSMRGQPPAQSLASRPLAVAQMQPAADPVRIGGALAAEPRAARPAAVAPVSTNAHAEPEVLVPREEIEMYRRLIAAAQNVPGAILVESPKDIVAVQSIKDIPIDPIKIDLIIPSVDGEGDRQ